MKPNVGFHQSPDRRLHRQFRGGTRGQSMVEFALVVPMVLVLLFAIVDMGRAYSAWVTTTNAAREGARCGITGTINCPDIVKKTRDTSGSYGTDGNLTVTVSYPPPPQGSSCVTAGAAGCSVVVATSYNLAFITPLVALVRMLPGGNTIPSTYTLTSTADMRIE